MSFDLEEAGKKAKNAAGVLARLNTEKKNDVLRKISEALVTPENIDKILKANSVDMENGRNKGMNEGLLDRLLLTESRIKAMSEGLLQVCDLEDPVGITLSETQRPNGLKLVKTSVPMGVIGIIYESRPNVTADAFGLCFKSGNAVILKGGSDALSSNMAITDCIRKALSDNGVPEDAICLISDTDRETTVAFMKLKKYVDILIPRGSARLIKSVVDNSTIPVIETGSGNCHIYVDKDADIEKAIPIIINAKTQRIGVCNAMESLVVHKDICDTFLPRLSKALSLAMVEVHADESSISYFDNAVPATEEDFSTEYLALKMSVKTVNSVEEAVCHVNACSTGHSEAIITENAEAAEYFLNNVDSACVYHNASTRFTDGFEFGFGAEIGISTQKLHARGPMGLSELTTYKYKIYGQGQIR